MPTKHGLELKLERIMTLTECIFNYQQMLNERLNHMSGIIDSINEEIQKLDVATDAEWDQKLEEVKQGVAAQVQDLQAQLDAAQSTIAENQEGDDLAIERITQLENAVLAALQKINEGNPTEAAAVLGEVQQPAGEDPESASEGAE